jgi:hypothetical protein
VVPSNATAQSKTHASARDFPDRDCHRFRQDHRAARAARGNDDGANGHDLRFADGHGDRSSGSYSGSARASSGRTGSAPGRTGQPQGCGGYSYPDAITEEISAATTPDTVGVAAIDRDYYPQAAVGACSI